MRMGENLAFAVIPPVAGAVPSERQCMRIANGARIVVNKREKVTLGSRFLLARMKLRFHWFVRLVCSLSSANDLLHRAVTAGAGADGPSCCS